MPANTPPARPIPPTTRARLAAAAHPFNWDQLLSEFAARQTPPNSPNARQTVPPPAPPQNEPTTPDYRTPNVPECPEMSHLARSHFSPPSPRLTCQTVPTAANARHTGEKCKTNPPPPRSRPLTPDQLRAARLLLAGHSTNSIAATLSLNRHTISKWKRLPRFQAELHRLSDTTPLPRFQYNPPDAPT